MEQSIRTFTSSFKCSKGGTESHKECPLLLGTISGTPENHNVTENQLKSARNVFCFD